MILFYQKTNILLRLEHKSESMTRTDNTNKVMEEKS